MQKIIAQAQTPHRDFFENTSGRFPGSSQEVLKKLTGHLQEAFKKLLGYSQSLGFKHFSVREPWGKLSGSSPASLQEVIRKPGELQKAFKKALRKGQKKKMSDRRTS